MSSEMKDGGAYTLHDQRGDAIADRYSVFRDGWPVLLFNCVDGGINPADLVWRLNAHDDLVAALESIAAFPVTDPLRNQDAFNMALTARNVIVALSSTRKGGE